MNKTFVVEGMTCAACSSSVERVLNRSPHVENASVNLTTKRLVIDYDDQEMTADDIIQKIEKAGFQATEHMASKKIVLPIEGMT
jgi:Cu+-exporting ATPase